MSLNNFVFKSIVISLTFSNCFYFVISRIFETNSTGEFAGTPWIVGGYRPLSRSLAKYVVSIRHREETEARFGYTHFCAGSIIAQNKILTAAHCFYRKRANLSPQDYKVVAKTPNRLKKNSNTVEANVECVILHPEYAENTLFNDIAVVVLRNDIGLASESAAIIPLINKSIKPGTVCQVIGWGRLYENGPLANEILHVKLNLHSRKYCRKTYPHFSSKKLCASNKDDQEKDACNGDSGGPMICEGTLTGIVSYGYGCASGHAGIYTNVFKYIDWIEHSGNTLLKPSFFLSIESLIIFLYI